MAFMTHPKHGATNTQEVEEHVKLGWVVSTHQEWLAKKSLPDAKIEQDEPVKRRGRPPRAQK